MRRTRIPRQAHVERHFTATETVRDIVIGMSDGLTVPFALAAGISGAIAVSHIIVTAGVAELAAGGISMGLGGYLAARTDFEHYGSERAREFAEVHDIPREEGREVFKIFHGYGLSDEDAERVTTAITADKRRWVDFMMRFELQLDKPDKKKRRSAPLRLGEHTWLAAWCRCCPTCSFRTPRSPYTTRRSSHYSLYFCSARSKASSRASLGCAVLYKPSPSEE